MQTTTERDEIIGDAPRARSMLAGSFGGLAGPAPERSAAGIAVWWHVRERELLRQAWLARVEDVAILVAGEPTVFAVATSGSSWTAAGRRGDVELAMWGRELDIDTIELVALNDPQRDLLPD